ncbi:MAG: M48 family metallopeptidase, partial [Lysobacteraceae bacterium]
MFYNSGNFGLPLAALAFPVLGQRPRAAIGLVLDTAHAAVNTDGRVSLSAYCLGTLLQAQMREALDPVRQAPFGRRRLAEARDAVALLLAAIARATHDAAEDARRAYLAGVRCAFPQDHLDYAPPANGVLALEPVWPLLDTLAPEATQSLVEALATAVSHDGRVSVPHAELLRTVCALLHCPLPPVLERG